MQRMPLRDGDPQMILVHDYFTKANEICGMTLSELNTVTLSTLHEFLKLIIEIRRTKPAVECK